MTRGRRGPKSPPTTAQQNAEKTIEEIDASLEPL